MLFVLTACEQRSEPPVVADASTSISEKIDEIAGDKTMTADLMQRSFQKGTFDNALRLALADSALATEMIAVIRADARYAALLNTKTSQSTTVTATKTASSRGTGTPSSATTQKSSSGDPLSKAERAMHQANEKLDQAGRVRDQVEEARRKTQGIFK